MEHENCLLSDSTLLYPVGNRYITKSIQTKQHCINIQHGMLYLYEYSDIIGQYNYSARFGFEHNHNPHFSQRRKLIGLVVHGFFRNNNTLERKKEIQYTWRLRTNACHVATSHNATLSHFCHYSPACIDQTSFNVASLVRTQLEPEDMLWIFIDHLSVCLKVRGHTSFCW